MQLLEFINKTTKNLDMQSRLFLRFSYATPLLLALLSFNSFAQIDAGALQQGLEKQLPSPSPLALPQPEERPAQTSPSSAKDSVTFEVKSFVLEGVSILPAEEVQAVLKPWLGRAVNFNIVKHNFVIPTLGGISCETKMRFFAFALNDNEILRFLFQ